MNASIRRLSILLAIAIALGASPAKAVLFDANAAFVANETDGSETNPFGPFTAGMTAGLGGAFTPFTAAQHSDAFNGITGLEGYFVSSPFLVPAALVNTTGSSLTTNFGTTLESSEILLHPDAANYGDLRFTVPVAGTYSIAGIFEKLNPQGNGEDVHVLVNGVPIYSQILTGADTENDLPGTFNLPLTVLAAGNTVDFAVGPINGDFGSDSVGFRGALTLVPEPASLVLLGVGAIGFFAVARRRRA